MRSVRVIVRAILTAVLLTVALHACTTTQNNGGPADLEVYAATEQRDEAHPRRVTGPDGAALQLAEAPIVTGEDVEHAGRTVDANGNDAILLELEDNAAERMKEASQQAMHGRLAVVWQGRVISAPRIMGVLSKRLMIIQNDDETSRADLDAILRALPE